MHEDHQDKADYVVQAVIFIPKCPEGAVETATTTRLRRVYEVDERNERVARRLQEQAQKFFDCSCSRRRSTL